MKENKNTVLKELTSLLKEYSETEPVYDICGIHHSSHCLCPTYLSPRMFTINLSLITRRLSLFFTTKGNNQMNEAKMKEHILLISNQIYKSSFEEVLKLEASDEAKGALFISSLMSALSNAVASLKKSDIKNEIIDELILLLTKQKGDLK